MRRFIRRLFVFAVISTLLSGVFLFIFLKFYGEPLIKSYIENNVAEKTGTKISIGAVKITAIPPLSLRLEGIEVRTANLSQEVIAESADVFLDLRKILPHLPNLNIFAKVTLRKPVVSIKFPYLPPQKIVPPAGPLGAVNVELPANLNLNLEVDVQDASIEVLQQQPDQSYLSRGRIDKLYSILKIPSLTEAWDFSIFSQLTSTEVSKFAIPLEVKSKLGLSLNPLRVLITSAEFRVGGVPGSISGWLDPSEAHYSLDVKSVIADLGKIRSFTFPGTWQGALRADVKLEKRESLKASGSFHLDKIFGDIEYLENGIKLSGSIGINGATNFSYSDLFRVENLNFAVNLTNMAVAYKDLFHKERAIPLTGIGSIVYDGVNAKVNQLNFELAHLKGSFSGYLGSGADSLFRLVIPRTNLSGLEKNFLLFKKPLIGTAEVKVEFRGDFKKPESIFVDVNPLVLNNVRVETSWKSADGVKSFDGLVSINTNSILKIQEHELKSSTTNTQLDLQKAKIIWADMFNKPNDSPFRVNVKASQKDIWSRIENMEFITKAGVIKASGTLRDPLKPMVEMRVSTKQLDLSRASQIFPILSKWKLSGRSTADLLFSGRFDPELGVEKTPLKISGTFSAQLPEFAYDTGAAAEGKVVIEATPEKPQSPLPPWPILLESSVRSDISIGKLFYKNLIVEGVSWKGTLDKGTLQGQADIRNLFGGTVSMSRIRVSLRETLPATQLSGFWGNLDTGKALDWMAPSWKGLLSGISSGSIGATLLHPSHPAFLKDSLVKGRITLKNAVLSTVKFDQIVNEKLAQLPGIGSNSKLNTRGVAGNITSDFEFTKEILQLRPIDIVTPENNQFKATGWVKIDKSIDIKGDVFLVNPPVQGSFLAANSDKLNRLVIPIQFEGKVNEPKLNIAEQTLKTMLAKTTDYEVNRAKSEAKKAVRQRVEQESQKAKEKIGEEINKGLKSIFGK